MERRIAAVLAADMVGFSRLIERDEVGTLKRQKRHLQELIEPTITAKKGRIVKLTGDGLIAEFSSVVEAVQCAVSVQAEMAAREEDFPEDEKIQYRVAVHLGDVVFDDGDVYGDGVNVAARLEGLAAPGGVVVSGTAYDVLKANVDVAYKSLGEQQLKNIATPVRVYQVVEGVPIAPATRPPKRVPWVVAAVVVLAMLGGLFWWQQRPDFEPLNPEELAFALPDKPSIAVAPFESISDDPLTKSLSEGLSANLISTLTISPDIVVISTHSLSDMSDLSVTEIAEKYGVQFVLNGSIQASQGQVRINARLSDLINGKSIWAGHWDRSADDVFAVQDEITERVFEELQVKLTLGEAARSYRDKLGTIENVLDWLEGSEHYLTWTEEGVNEAARIWGKIYERNPELAGSNELLSQIHFQRFVLGLVNGFEDQGKARRFFEKAIEIGGDGKSYAYLGLQQYFSNEPLEAYENVKIALKLNPGDPEVLIIGGLVFAFGSKLEQGIDMMQRGIRLQPYHPPWIVGDLCLALYQAQRHEETQDWALGVVASQTKDIRAKVKCLGTLAAMSVEKEDFDTAQAYVDQIMDLEPRASINYFRYRFGMVAMYDQEHVEEFFAALREAGLPY